MHTRRTPTLTAALIGLLLLGACAQQQTAAPASAPTAPPATSMGMAHSGATPAPGAASSSNPPLASALDPARGQEIGFTYEAFLSPQQEPGEEKDTPGITPKEFRSTAPSLLRNERTSRGHGVVRFSKDLSKAYVDVKVENINPQDVNMFHIHCGRPDLLGPILIDFALATNLQENLADGMFSVTLTNADIEKESVAGKGLVGAFTAGCPIIPGTVLGDTGDVKTIAGMQYIAQAGELYFNLHTKGQTFYGDMRGRLIPVQASTTAP